MQSLECHPHALSAGGIKIKAPKDGATTDSTSEGTATKKGRTVTITTEDMQKRRNDVKARTTLLLALPDEQQYDSAKIEKDDLNQKFLTSLAPKWLMHTIVWRNRSDLDTMSLDDLYNHLKVYESEVQKKSESNSQNMAFISSSKNSSGNEKVNTASISTASTQVSPAGPNVATASISLDTACAYIASQSNGSQIKYEDINQIDEDDIEEMDIKWNMALLSMRADRYWKKTGKRAPISQDKGWRDNYRQGSKVEEQASKALMAIDGVGWDWSFMVNEKENHALVADEEAPTEFASMAKTSAESERSDKIKEGLGYSDVPSPAQFYSPSKKDMSWTGLPEFADDTITDYTRPSPSVESNPNDLQNSSSSASENGEATGSILSKLEIKFVRPADSPTVVKTNKKEIVRKPTIKYAELYRKTLKRSNVRGNQRNWNNLKSQQLGKNFVMKKACYNCSGVGHLSYDCGK
uniref:CCHC-type domain-containing protein n=1 Tax=Tanacetum cinerariifolium TaxID=118510 RepID=A0A6L2K8G4_TANCI|nr:hypothetical protein [Tanacetum cinerariifolium]